MSDTIARVFILSVLTGYSVLAVALVVWLIRHLGAGPSSR